MSVSHRKNRAAIRISGVDAHKLINDVLTAEIKAEAGSMHWWALLSPQGKIQAEGLVGWADEAFWLDVHADVADAFLKRMRMYKLRATAEIEDLRESHAVGWSADAPSAGIADRDPRHADMGYRVIAAQDAIEDWDVSDAAFATVRIGLGIGVLGEDFAADTAFPHDIGMDLLSGVDFAKGCYVGQEVVSRMQHRGTARRRPVIVSGIDTEAGASVVCAGKEAGIIGRIENGTAVAILRLDRVNDPAEALVNNSAVQLALPGWASYDFPDSSNTSENTP